MRGTRAKRLRAEAYGDRSRRLRSYSACNDGQVVNTGPRAYSQALKRGTVELRHYKFSDPNCVLSNPQVIIERGPSSEQ